MKTLSISVLLTLALTLAACGGGNSHEALMQASVGQMTKFAEALEGVKDKASWEATKPKLESVLTEMESIGKKVKALGEPDEATKKAIGDAMTKQMGDVQQRLMQASMKVMQVEGIGEDVGKFMTNFRERMKSTK